MNKHKLLALGLSFLALASLAIAADAKKTWTFALTDVTARASYDTNVYQTSEGPLGSQKSGIFSVTPNMKLTGKLRDADLTFGYAPTVNLYTKNQGLDYLDQTFTAEEKMKAFDFDWNLKQSLQWVAGQNAMPIYANDAGTTYTPGFTAPAEQGRTSQLLWKESASVKRSFDKWLLEFVSAGTYQDFRSRHSSTSGFLNCTDRGDVNGGFNVGYNFWKKLHLLAGYRLGYQFQGVNPIGGNVSYTNHYNRLLVGARGNVTDQLSVDFLVGPDFRNFTETTYAGFDTTQAFWYYQGSATYKPTKSDTFTLAFNRFVQMGSTGASVYEDVNTGLKYSRKITSTISADAGVNMLNRRYLPNTGTVTQCYTFYTPSVGVNYAPKGNLSYRLAYAYDNSQADTPRSATAPAVQEFQRSVISVEAKYKF